MNQVETKKRQKSFQDLTGQKFVRWTVIEIGARAKCGLQLWKCKCECGTEKEILGTSLKASITKSCGCLKREMAAARGTTHGMSNTPLYRVWHGMIERCEDEKHIGYLRYGGRGESRFASGGIHLHPFMPTWETGRRQSTSWTESTATGITSPEIVGGQLGHRMPATRRETDSLNSAASYAA
jgi:hypothetical protein